MANILIAEDETILCLYLKNILMALGHSVVGIAYSGEEAAKLASSVDVDIVFMDIAMSDKFDGIDACKEIKKKKPDIKIIFLTAYPESIQDDVLKDIQFDAYLEKPFTRYMLKDCLSEILE